MLFINKLSNSIACLLYFINLQLVIPGRTWILLYLGRTVYKRLWACLALYYVYKKNFFNLFLKYVSKWVLWERMVLGVMPPVHVQGPVCPDHVAASAWLPVSWLCRFGCPPVQWCPVGRSPPCVGSIPEQWMITPLHLGRSNP